MATKLENLHLEEVSAIIGEDEPANKGARIVLMKKEHDRRDGIMVDDDKVGVLKRLAKFLDIGEDELAIKEEDRMDPKTKQTLDELTAKVDGLTEQLTVAQTVSKVSATIAKAGTAEEVDAAIATLTNEDARKEVAEIAEARKAELTKAEGDAALKAFRSKLPSGLQKAFDDMSDDDKRRFMGKFSKADEGDADPVTKALAAVTETNEKLVAKVESLEAKDALAATKAELADLDGVVPDLNELAKQLTSLRKADAEAADAMLTQLKATAKQAKESRLFSVVGNDGEGSGTVAKVETKIAAAVKKYQDAHPDVTPEQAEAEVLKANPALYDEYNAAQREA